MKIGFLTDVDGYRAPIHPESIEKYSFDVHLEKNIFDYLNYADSSLDNVKTISNLSDLDIVACVENIQDKTIKELKEGAVLIGIFDFDKIEEIKSLRLGYRELNIEDSQLIVDWRNSSRLRKVSRKKQKFTLENHKKWFIKTRSTRSDFIFFEKNTRKSIGMISLENKK